MQYQYFRAKESAEKETHLIVKKAKEHRADTYRTTLLFLKD